MNFPNDYFSNIVKGSGTQFTKDTIIDINERIKDFIIYLNNNREEPFTYIETKDYFLFVHRCEDEDMYNIVVAPNYYSLTMYEDELVKDGLLPKGLKQATIGDIILASNNKKYKIIEDMSGEEISLLDIETSKIVEGWEKDHFFNILLSEKLPLIYDTDICPIEIVKE